MKMGNWIWVCSCYVFPDEGPDWWSRGSSVMSKLDPDLNRVMITYSVTCYYVELVGNLVTVLLVNILKVPMQYNHYLY